MPAVMMRFWKAATPACDGSWKGMSGPEFQTMRLILVRMPLDQRDQLVGVGERVVDAAQHDVLEGDPLAVAQRDGVERLEERGDVPFARDGHDGLADDVVGGVEADGELGPDGLAGEVQNAGQDARGADGHARLGDAHVDQQADGGHEVGVVEKGLAHAHEDEVDACRGGVAAAAAEVDPVAVEHGGDLSGDLARGEVAADAELGGEAELAVDGAADLAGDADGGAAVGEGGGVAGCVFLLLLFGGKGAVAAFAAVAVGHPDGLDGLAVGHADQVALGAVDGAGGLDDLGQSDSVALGGEGFAQGGGQGGDLVEGGDPLAVDGFDELVGPVGTLAEARHEVGEGVERLAEEGLAVGSGFGYGVCFVQHSDIARSRAGSG